MTTLAETGPNVRNSWERLDSYLSALGSEDAKILRSDIASLLSDSKPADGRMARSHQTRRAIVDAMRALHAEGDLRPTAPRVAARAGVSLRTVWQHFADMEALLLEAGRRDLEVLLQIVRPIAADLPLADRIEHFADQRTRVHEQMTPGWFAAELGKLAGEQRRVLADSLHGISIWAFWDSLRADVGLSPQQARSSVVTIMTSLLREAGFSI